MFISDIFIIKWNIYQLFLHIILFPCSLFLKSCITFLFSFFLFWGQIIADDIAELNRNHTTTAAKIAEHKRKLLELQHRVLKVLVLQEITRKMGYAIQADEEQLRIKLEAIQAELSAPTQFKVCIFIFFPNFIFRNISDWVIYI